MVYYQELIVGAVGLVVTLAFRVFTANRLVRSKLRLALFAFAGQLVIGAALWAGVLPEGTLAQLRSVTHLLFALGAVTFVVVTAVNPWRVDRTPEQFPNIVQDTIIIAAFMLVGTFLMQEKFLTTSAVGAVVIGFALQDTLGNTFAGLAIQVEKPFRADHWVRIGSYEGRVMEITWRATRLRTKSGDAVIVPNNIVSKEAITNFSEPAAPTRLVVEVGVSYAAQPNLVKKVILDALRDAPLVLAEPAPEVLIHDFSSSSITYRIRFWVADWGQDDLARDQVRSCVFYAFRRSGIEIPFPIQVHHRASKVPALVSDEDRIAWIEAVELFKPLSALDRAMLAGAARDRLFGAGQTVVRQGEQGDSMFVVGRGRVRVTILPGPTEVATIQAGGYFGEMSLLTGEPRTATVSTITDCTLLEISAQDFRRIALAQPAVLEQMTAVVADRRAGLARSRDTASAAGHAADTPRSFLLKVREFLRL